MESVIRLLPDALREFTERHNSGELEEIRLRAGRCPSILMEGKEYTVTGKITTAGELDFILSAASGNSLYAVNSSLCEGFIPLPGGHRLGISGQAVMEHGAVKTFRDVSSVSIRIAKERTGIGMVLRDSTIILGPPGCGKTTLLRDCVRILSDESKCRVGLVDERCEIAACYCGVPQFYVGQRTDVLSGCDKCIGINMMLRSMNPQWIAVDEITQEKDVDAICKASYCGVCFLATAHAKDVNDLDNRPIYRLLKKCGVFLDAIILKRDHTYTRQRLVDI